MSGLPRIRALALLALAACARGTPGSDGRLAWCDGDDVRDVRHAPPRWWTCGAPCAGDCAKLEDGARTAPFVVDGVHGWLRTRSPDGPVRATALVFGRGSAASDLPFVALPAAGVEVVGVRWDAPAPTPGWAEPTSPEPMDERQAAARVAAVIRAVAARLPDDRPLVLVGQGRGAAGVIGAWAWHGIGPLAHAVVLGDPEVRWDAAAACRARAGAPPPGRCLRDLRHPCADDAGCPEGACAALPTTPPTTAAACDALDVPGPRRGLRDRFEPTPPARLHVALDAPDDPALAWSVAEVAAALGAPTVHPDASSPALAAAVLATLPPGSP